MKKIATSLLFCLLTVYSFADEHLLVEVPVQEDSSMVYDFPERMAQFPGGSAAMDLFILKNKNYPQSLKDAGVVGKVYVQFIVEKDGSLTNISIRRGTNTDLDKEALNVVEKMPNWIPGSVRGKIVRVKYTLPITF